MSLSSILSDLGRMLNMILVVLAVTLGGLAIKNNFSTTRQQPTVAESMPIGTTINPFVVRFGDSTVTRVPIVGSQPTILYLMRTTCQACRKNEEQWLALARAAKPYAHILELSLESLSVLRAHQGDTPARVATIADASEQDRIFREYHMEATPTMYLFDKNGTLTKAWVGMFPPGWADDVLDAIRAQVATLK